MKKRILSCVLVLCLLCSLAPMAALAAGAEDFTDVTTDAWYYDYVDYVAENGYFLGVGDSLFDPDGTMTRAMFVVVLSRIAGAEVDNTTSTFSDVPAGQWYTGAVAWAVEAGITNGTSSTTFSPDSAVTRQDMCVFMDRFIDWYEGENTTTTKKTEHQDDTQLIDAFGDAADIASYATSSVEACRVYGLVEGYQDGNFYPLLASTRAEIAAVIYRLTWTETAISTGGGPGGSTTYYTVTYYDFVDDSEEYAVLDTDKKASGSSWYAIEYNNKYDRDDYVFTGWNTVADGSGTSYAVGDPIPVSKDMPLYAQGVKNNDYIGIAVAASMSYANEQWGETVTDNSSSVTVDSIIFNPTPTYKTAGNDTREQSISATATLGEDSVAAAVELVTNTVLYFVGGTPTGSGEYISGISDVREIVDEVAEAFGITLTGVARDEIVNTVMNTGLTEARTMWRNFYDAKGDYVTGSFTVTVGDTVIVITVDNNGAYLTSGTATEAARSLAFALAKEMYWSIGESNQYASDVELEGTITLKFTESTTSNTYAAATPEYPHVYPFTINLTLTDESETVLYKKESGKDYIKLNLLQYENTYTDLLDDVVTKALTSETVLSVIRDKLDSELATYIIDATERAGVVAEWTSDNKDLLVQYYKSSDTTFDNVTIDNSAITDNAKIIAYMNALAQLGVTVDFDATIKYALNNLDSDTMMLLNYIKALKTPATVNVATITALLTDTTIRGAMANMSPAALSSVINAINSITIDGSVTIGNYGTISIDDLQDKLENATTAADVCAAIVNILGQLKKADDLCLESFSEQNGGIEIIIGVGTRTHTVNIVIE